MRQLRKYTSPNSIHSGLFSLWFSKILEEWWFLWWLNTHKWYIMNLRWGLLGKLTRVVLCICIYKEILVYSVWDYVTVLALLSNTYALLDHHWYIIGHKNVFHPNISKKVTIHNSPISIWRDKNNNFAEISDVCHHRGVSLSKGRVDSHTNCIVCPHYNFRYDKKRRLMQTPGQASRDFEGVYPQISTSKWRKKQFKRDQYFSKIS